MVAWQCQLQQQIGKSHKEQLKLFSDFLWKPTQRRIKTCKFSKLKTKKEVKRWSWMKLDEANEKKNQAEKLTWCLTR